MPGMGSSAGRSKRNRTGDGANHRATSREREFIDPPGHLDPSRVTSAGNILTDRGIRVMSFIAWGSYAAFCGALGAVICKWFGLL